LWRYLVLFCPLQMLHNVHLLRCHTFLGLYTFGCTIDLWCHVTSTSTYLPTLFHCVPYLCACSDCTDIALSSCYSSYIPSHSHPLPLEYPCILPLVVVHYLLLDNWLWFVTLFPLLLWCHAVVLLVTFWWSLFEFLAVPDRIPLCLMLMPCCHAVIVIHLYLPLFVYTYTIWTPPFS